MDKQEVDSSVIRATGYAYVLEIEFQGGRVYQYFDVPQDVYQGFLTSDSKGKYFNAQIRGKFPYHEITIKTPQQTS